MHQSEALPVANLRESVVGDRTVGAWSEVSHYCMKQIYTFETVNQYFVLHQSEALSVANLREKKQASVVRDWTLGPWSEVSHYTA